MSNDEIFGNIKAIIFSVPGEVYKYEKPENCFDEEWNEASDKEKAFMLVENLLINLNREEINKKKVMEYDFIKIKLDVIPRFYGTADENMFFNAICSIPAIKNVEGRNEQLYLYCARNFTNEEREFLAGLLKRYQVPAPLEVQC